MSSRHDDIMCDQAKDLSTSTSLSLREGLPFGFINTTGKLTGSTGAALSASREVSRRLRDFADEIEGKESLICLAVDNMAEDVIGNRMPPLEDQMPDRGMRVCPFIWIQALACYVLLETRNIVAAFPLFSQ